MIIPEFGDLRRELMAKGLAAYIVLPEEIADDVNDTMTRAREYIQVLIEALSEIKMQGISAQGHMNSSAMLADTALNRLGEFSK